MYTRLPNTLGLFGGPGPPETSRKAFIWEKRFDLEARRVKSNCPLPRLRGQDSAMEQLVLKGTVPQVLSS